MLVFCSWLALLAKTYLVNNSSLVQPLQRKREMRKVQLEIVLKLEWRVWEVNLQWKGKVRKKEHYILGFECLSSGSLLSAERRIELKCLVRREQPWPTIQHQHYLMHTNTTLSYTITIGALWYSQEFTYHLQMWTMSELWVGKIASIDELCQAMSFYPMNL